MKDSSTKEYYIWGQFDTDSMDALQSVYNKVNAAFKGPLFKIHMTIAGPLTSADNTTIALFNVLGEKYQPIELVPEKYSYTDQRYRALFMDIQKSEALLNLKSNIDGTFGLQNKNYRPHISLFYGIKSLKNKKELITRLPKVPYSILLSKLCLVRVGEDVAEWEIVHEVLL